MIESADKETLSAEIKNLFNGSLLRPSSVEEYVATLNGEGGEWAERILREATPFAPVSTIAGKPRFRKLLVMTKGAANSDVFRSLREALSDQALQIVAREHPETDLLCMEDEWCLCASEFPEVVELIKDTCASTQRASVALHRVRCCRSAKLLPGTSSGSRASNSPVANGSRVQRHAAFRQ